MLLTVFLGVGCGGGGIDPKLDASPELDAATPDAAVTPWPFPLPANFPTPRLPEGRALTAELAELGRFLFYDKRLSGNGTQACASCHEQARAFTDALEVPTGSTGDVLVRNSLTLTNSAYTPALTWVNPTATTLEDQALIPIFGKHPVEIGANGNKGEILQRFAEDPDYPARFAAAFPGIADPITFPRVIEAIAAFERRLISGNSRADQNLLDESEIRGRELFFSEELECHHCHGGFNFTISMDHAGLPLPQSFFFNTGLYNVGGTGGYPVVDEGLWEFTFVNSDRGKFRPPTLRNIDVTGPYMHDGSVATLEEVVDIYQRGGRNIESGVNQGDGKFNPYKSPFVNGFTLTTQERIDLLAFLRALTDEEFLTDPTLSDPFE